MMQPWEANALDLVITEYTIYSIYIVQAKIFKLLPGYFTSGRSFVA